MSTNSESTHQYNKVTFGAEILPDAPEGEWAATIVRGRSKVSPTKNKDPMLTINVKLDRAEDAENESSQGTTLPVRFIFGDDNGKNRWMTNRTKKELNAICSQLGLDPDIYALSADKDPGECLAPFIELLEGREVQCWTTHRVNKQDGRTETNITFSKPGGYSANANSDD